MMAGLYLKYELSDSTAIAIYVWEGYEMHLTTSIIRLIPMMILVFFLIASSSGTEERTSKQILILASYNPGLKWTDSIGSEIENQLSIYYPTAQFVFEYMDAKKQSPTEVRLEELKELYQNKFKDRHFDVIISSDDDAFQFLLDRRDDLFPGVPVVFCGVNFFKDEMLSGKKGFTGVVEAFDMPDTISLMLKLHPKTRQIVIVNDRTTTGKANREVMNQTLPKFGKNASFAVWDNMTAEELQRNASSLHEGSLIFLLNYNRDREGKVLTHEESAWILRSASSVPIYGTRDVYMGFGVLGGAITTGPVQGSLAADLALRILMGDSADELPVIKTPPNYYMFDVIELRRFNISLSDLPSESIFINQPFGAQSDLRNRNLSHLDLYGYNLSQSNLHGTNLSFSNLSRASLRRSDLSSARLVRANLSYSYMADVDLHGADLTEANIKNTDLARADMRSSNITRSDLSGACLDQATLSESTIREANLDNTCQEGTNLSSCDLTRASLRNAFLNRARLRDSLLVGANLTNASMVGGNIIAANLTGADLSCADLSEARISRANFYGANLRRSRLLFTNLIGANLSHADISFSNVSGSGIMFSDISHADLQGTSLVAVWMFKSDLVGANLRKTNLNMAHLNDSDLSGSDLREADLTNADLSGANLTGADLSDARLVGTDLTLAIINGATLRRTSLVGSKLNWAKLSGSSFTDCQFARAELFGVKLSNSDLSGSDFTRAYLTRANLSGSRMRNAVLDHTDLTSANLSSADLSFADLENVYLNDADLSSANLTGLHMEAFDQKGTVWRKANLRSATMKTGTIMNEDFSGADLRNAHFEQIYMNGAKFTGANLSGAEFNMAAFENIDFSGADLREVKYDMVALQFFAMSRLDGAQMSPDLREDLDLLLSAQTNATEGGSVEAGLAIGNISDSGAVEPKLEIKSVGAGTDVRGASVFNQSELNMALLDFGPIGDHGWTYEAHIGAARMAEALPYVNLTERENVAGANASQIISDYARDGYDLIFCHSYDFGDNISEVAAKYPNTTFMWGAGVRKLAPNAGTYFGRMYEVQYLAGIVAGGMTKADKIGFSAAVPISEVVRGIDAFARGVAVSNPGARVYVEWIGGWYDPENETKAASTLISKGCDVVTHHSDSDSTGAVAENAGTYFISFGSDLESSTSHVFLTGAIWNWEPVMADVVEAVHNGTWESQPGQDWWYGLKEGAVVLAPLSYLVPDDLKALVEVKKKAIASGEIDVFPGMSDEDLREIYYFEPNVVGDLPKRS